MSRAPLLPESRAVLLDQAREIVARAVEYEGERMGFPRLVELLAACLETLDAERAEQGVYIATLEARLVALEAFERLERALELYTAAVRRYAAAREAELRTEDDGARVKAEAIRRLRDAGTATSATAAEQILYQDDEYAAWQAMRRTYVVATILARGEMVAAELRARAAESHDPERPAAAEGLRP